MDSTFHVVELAPIRETPELYDGIEAEIQRIFRDEIYKPFLKELLPQKVALQNALDDLLRAIQSGQIYFSRGEFKGRFNAQISRELKKLGARWNPKTKGWRIPLKDLPIEAVGTISTAEATFTLRLRKLDERITKLVPEQVAQQVKLENLFDTTLHEVDQKIRKTLKSVTIPPKLTTENRAKIAKEYTNNLQLYIQKFTEKEIVELRNRVHEKAMRGLRYEGIIKEIQDSYGVSMRKAKFLARQETSLLMTRFKQYRYEDAGINQYKWTCVIGSPNHPVRPMHEALNGKIFDWKNPPVTAKNGARNHPGQDYGCRCYAKPIVKFIK